MVEEEHISYAEASYAVCIYQSMISHWKKQEVVLGAVTRPDAFQLHLGPVSIRGKGLPL
jgi:hypothetical protein